jgi:hypothetical protein
VTVPPPGQSCATCDFFLLSQCHFFPPGFRGEGWPAVSPTDWCGHWGLLPPSTATPPTPATTAFDPASTSASLTLSNANLTAAANADNFGALTRSVNSHSTGKYYAEFTVDFWLTGGVSGNAQGVGICDSTQGIDTYMGADVHGIAYYQDGTVQFNGGVLTTIMTFAVGNIISMAVDMGNQTIWWRVNGGNWNNDAAANPATNTNGSSFAGIGATLYAAMDIQEATGGPQQFTANFGASAYAYAAPSGFGNW